LPQTSIPSISSFSPTNLIRMLIRSLFLVLLGLSCFRVFGQSQADWQEETSCDGTLPIARHEAAFVEVKGKFYLLGGRRVQDISIYDPKVQTWTTGAKPPLELHHFQPIVLENEIWVGGAFTGGWPGETPVPNFYIYTPASNSWRKGPEIPEGRRRGAAGATLYKGKIYLVCGIIDGHRSGHQNWLDAYDLKTGTWETLPDAPHRRDHFHATATANRIYVLGGRRSRQENGFDDTEPAVDVYDQKSGMWTTLEDTLPTPRAGCFNVLLGKHVCVVGGESGTQVPAHSELEGLHVKTHQFHSFPPMPEGRHGTGIIRWKGSLYVASGNGDRGGGKELTSQWKLGKAKKAH